MRRVTLGVRLVHHEAGADVTVDISPIYNESIEYFKNSTIN